MTDIEQGRFKPSSTDRDELPTAYGGTNPIEPKEPGQSLGQVPDPDDAAVDEAGDRPAESGSLAGDDDGLGVESDVDNQLDPEDVAEPADEEDDEHVLLGG